MTKGTIKSQNAILVSPFTPNKTLEIIFSLN